MYFWMLNAFSYFFKETNDVFSHFYSPTLFNPLNSKRMWGVYNNNQKSHFSKSVHFVRGFLLYSSFFKIECLILSAFTSLIESHVEIMDNEIPKCQIMTNSICVE